MTILSEKSNILILSPIVIAVVVVVVVVVVIVRILIAIVTTIISSQCICHSTCIRGDAKIQ